MDTVSEEGSSPKSDACESAPLPPVASLAPDSDSSAPSENGSGISDVEHGMGSGLPPPPPFVDYMQNSEARGPPLPRVALLPSPRAKYPGRTLATQATPGPGAHADPAEAWSKIHSSSARYSLGSSRPKVTVAPIRPMTASPKQAGDDFSTNFSIEVLSARARTPGPGTYAPAADHVVKKTSPSYSLGRALPKPAPSKEDGPAAVVLLRSPQRAVRRAPRTPPTSTSAHGPSPGSSLSVQSISPHRRAAGDAAVTHSALFPSLQHTRPISCFRCILPLDSNTTP